MKTQNILPILALSVIAACIPGCKEETKSVIGSAADSINKTAETAKDASANAVSTLTDKAKDLTAPASAKAQELINTAKGLVAEGKFQDALAKLKEIGSEKLSVDQQALVDGLKAQIEKSLGATPKAATDAAGAAGGLLPK